MPFWHFLQLPFVKNAKTAFVTTRGDDRVNVLCQRYSTGVAIAQFLSASQKEKPSEDDIFNQRYLRYSSLTSTFEHTYVILICQRFYLTQSRNWKGSLVRFHTTAQKLRNNFISDFLLCASIDYNRYRSITRTLLWLYYRFVLTVYILLIFASWNKSTFQAHFTDAISFLFHILHHFCTISPNNCNILLLSAKIYVNLILIFF